MTALVVSQPMFLPWRGIFEQAMLAGTFVLYDDVQLPRGRSFETRVQIKTAEGWRWLTLPVDRSGGSTPLIRDARLAGQGWRRSHLDVLRSAYRSAPYFAPVFEELVEPLYAHATDSVSEFCSEGMLRVMRHLGIGTPVATSSELGIGVGAGGSRRLLEHCLHFGADEYVTGHGARNYIDYDLFESHGVRICYMEYALTPYPQVHGPFNPYVTILDLLFNTGPDAPRFLGSPAVYWKDLALQPPLEAK